MPCGHFTLPNTCGLLQCTATSQPAASSQRSQQPAAAAASSRASRAAATATVTRRNGATAIAMMAVLDNPRADLVEQR